MHRIVRSAPGNHALFEEHLREAVASAVISSSVVDSRVVRRSCAAALRMRTEPEPFVLSDLTIQYERRWVTVAGRIARLTAIEFEMLKLLLMNADRLVTYDTVLRQIRNGQLSGDAGAVHAFVKKLRGKLGDNATNHVWMFTEHGSGYRMPRPDEVQETG